MPPSSPSVNCRLWWNLPATWRSTRTASRVTSTPMPSPGSTSTLRSMRTHESISRRHLGLLTGADQRHDFFVHQALLAVIGYRGEAKVEVVQFRPGKSEP